jgi:carbamoyl-phosphate synthase small subunit
MKATLALENGLWYEGDAAGAPGETGGEVVFNTSLTGYQEILTDPYWGRSSMTCPEMATALRRRRRVTPQVSGFIIRDESPSPATGDPTARCATISCETALSRSPTSTPAR